MEQVLINKDQIAYIKIYSIGEEWKLTHHIGFITRRESWKSNHRFRYYKHEIDNLKKDYLIKKDEHNNYILRRKPYIKVACSNDRFLNINFDNNELLVSFLEQEHLNDFIHS